MRYKLPIQCAALSVPFLNLSTYTRGFQNGIQEIDKAEFRFCVGSTFLTKPVIGSCKPTYSVSTSFDEQLHLFLEDFQN